MQLILDVTDLAKLSPDARAEIFRLLGSADGVPTTGTALAMIESKPQQDSSTYNDMDERGLINLTPALADQLIKGINSKSIEYLRWLSESPDEEMELLFPAHPEYKDFSSFKREFIGPVNRRLRTITNNRKAELFFVYKYSEDSELRHLPRLVGEDLDHSYLVFARKKDKSIFVPGGRHDASFVYVSKKTAASLRVVLKTEVTESTSNATK